MMNSATNLDGFDNKWAMSVNMVSYESGDLTLYFKGAPERVLRLCSTILINNQAVELTEEHKAKFMETYEYMAGKGHRVLASAQLSFPGDHPLTAEAIGRKINLMFPILKRRLLKRLTALLNQFLSLK